MHLERQTTIKTVQEQLQIIADSFYQQKMKKAYHMFSEIIDPLIQLISQIYEWNAKGDIEVAPDELMQSFQKALQALEEKDEVLLADLLQYELLPMLAEIERQYERCVQKN